MRIKLDPGAFAPVRVHKTDAGMDIKAMYGATIGPGDSAVFHSGVHVELPPNTCGLIVSKSGLNVNGNITSTGLIDEGYDGEIVIKLYNHGKKVIQITRGQRISQLVVLPVLYESIEIVDEINAGERGSNGFGSTGV